MSASVEEIKRWLDTLEAGQQVGVDDGGLCLRVVDDPGPYYEIGGMPEGEHDEEDKY